MGRHASIREIAHHVIRSRQPLQLAEFLNAIIRRADDLNADVEIVHLVARDRVLQLGVGLRHLAVGLVALHVCKVTVREIVVGVDRIPLGAEILRGAFLGFCAGRRAGDVGQDDRRGRLVADADSDLAVALNVRCSLLPLVLHDHHHAEAELGHDLGRLRAHRRRIEAAFRIGHWPWADRHLRDFVELTAPLEHVVTKGRRHELGGFSKPRARFLHRNAEACILRAGCSASKAKHASSAAQQIQVGNLLGHADRVMPREHDHTRAERDTGRLCCVVGQELQRARRHRVAGEVMLQRKQGIEAERLGEIRQREVLCQHGGVGTSRLRQNAYVGSDSHAATPLTSPRHASSSRVSRDAVLPCRRRLRAGHDGSYPSAASGSYADRQHMINEQTQISNRRPPLGPRQLQFADRLPVARTHEFCELREPISLCAPFARPAAS